MTRRRKGARTSHVSNGPPGGIRDRVKELRRVRVGDLLPHPKNWRRHTPGQGRGLRAMLDGLGFAGAIVTRETPQGLQIIDGHLRSSLEPDAVLPVLVTDLDEKEAELLLATYDPLSAMAEADSAALQALLEGIETDSADVQALLERLSNEHVRTPRPPAPSLADRFLVPPFSVLDARQGYWQERKAHWLALGIRSELGRGEALACNPADAAGTDPMRRMGRRQQRASPGGSPRPGRDPRTGKIVRTDGRARPLPA